MASRWGRNKRRQAREAIAQLEQNLVRKDEQIENIHKRYSGINRWVERLERIVPKYSSLRLEMPVNHLGARQAEWDEGVHTALPVMTSIEDYTLQPINLERVRMLVMAVEAHPDEFNQTLRFAVTFGDNRQNYQYAISESLLRATGIDEEGRAAIAADVSNMIYNHIVGTNTR